MDRQGLRDWYNGMMGRALALPRLSEEIFDLKIHMNGMKHHSLIAKKTLADFQRRYDNEFDSIVDELGVHIRERMEELENAERDRQTAQGATRIEWGEEGL
jgi:hypothetical protein